MYFPYKIPQYCPYGSQKYKCNILWCLDYYSMEFIQYRGNQNSFISSVDHISIPLVEIKSDFKTKFSQIKGNISIYVADIPNHKEGNRFYKNGYYNFVNGRTLESYSKDSPDSLEISKNLTLPCNNLISFITGFVVYGFAILAVWNDEGNICDIQFEKITNCLNRPQSWRNKITTFWIDACLKVHMMNQINLKKELSLYLFRNICNKYIIKNIPNNIFKNISKFTGKLVENKLEKIIKQASIKIPDHELCLNMNDNIYILKYRFSKESILYSDDAKEKWGLLMDGGCTENFQLKFFNSLVHLVNNSQSLDLQFEIIKICLIYNKLICNQSNKPIINPQLICNQSNKLSIKPQLISLQIMQKENSHIFLKSLDIAILEIMGKIISKSYYKV